MNKSKEKIKENPIIANRAIYMANPCHIIDKKVCRNARCTFFLVYHRYKSVYFLQAAIIRRFL